MVSYCDYFKALGYKNAYYDASTGKFDTDAIKADIESIQERWKEKYPLMDFKTANLRFDSLVNFCHTYTNEMEFLNLDPK